MEWIAHSGFFLEKVRGGISCVSADHVVYTTRYHIATISDAIIMNGPNIISIREYRCYGYLSFNISGINFIDGSHWLDPTTYIYATKIIYS